MVTNRTSCDYAEALGTRVPLQYQVSIPLAVSLVLYVLIGFLRPEDTPERLAIIESVNTDGSGSAAARPPVPESADAVGGKD